MMMDGEHQSRPVQTLRVNADKVDQAFMAILMGEHRQEKNQGMTINLIQSWFPLTDINKPVIVGSFAWTSRALMQKWILRPYAHHSGWEWVTPADIARDYLSVKYKDRKQRITSEQYRLCVDLKRTPPLMAIPQRMDNAYYIDLKSAYWNILRSVGWDVDYCPEKFIGVQSDVEDFPYAHIKLARNTLVSSGIGNDVRIWTGEKLVFKRKFNMFQNHLLWSLVQDVLNSVAREIMPYAVYINTDGYIVKPEFKDTVLDIIGEWGLPASIKYQGRCEVYNLGQYNIEGKSWVKPRSKMGKACVKIHHPNVKWLKQAFSFWSYRRNVCDVQF